MNRLTKKGQQDGGGEDDEVPDVDRSEQWIGDGHPPPQSAGDEEDEEEGYDN